MLTKANPSDIRSTIPFDSEYLDRLLDEANIDVLVINSKHNIQYLLGGHRSFFFDYMDAMALSRYLPVLIYPKGAPEKAGYFGHRLETHQTEIKPFWTPVCVTTNSTTTDTMAKAVEHLRKIDVKARRVAVEYAFLPVDAAVALRAANTDAEMVDAVFVMEKLRARKTPEELAKLRMASDLVLESMQAVIAGHGPGATKQEINDALKREEVNRGLTFEYCLIAAGASHNRAPGPQRWEEGDVLSVDSGGNYHGYIGDIARMAILGEPDSELVDLLGEIEDIQRAAFKPIKAGVMGKEIYAAGEGRMRQSKLHNHMEFLAHGMGLVSHEIPHLTRRGPSPYGDEDAHKPLEAGYVISVETTLKHPSRGFIKLEDTVVVTDKGHDIYGEGARGWNRGGTALA
jgi:Xaa-Pro aminopeptidase